MQGQQIVNARGLALDVAAGKDAEGQTVLMWTSHAGSNQKWTIEYDETAKCGGYPIVEPLTKKEETIDTKKSAEPAEPKTTEAKKPAAKKPEASAGKKPEEPKPAEPTKGELPVPIPAGTTPL